MPGCDDRQIWIEVDASAIRHNAAEIRRAVGPGVAIHACLKRDGYGCGAGLAAHAALAGGVDGFAVGSIDDAAAIRAAGVAAPVLLYPGTTPDLAARVEALDLTPTISGGEDIAAWNAGFTVPRPVFLKIDAGMLRGGVGPDDAPAIARAIHAAPRLRLAGVYGHLYGSDADSVAAQFRVFARACAAIAAAGIIVPCRMIAASEALVRSPAMDLEAVDPGRLLFGEAIVADPRRPMALREAITGIGARLALRKTIPPAADTAILRPDLPETVTEIGIVPMGWGDGLPRSLLPEAAVLIGGQRARIVGPVHMEHIRIDLTGFPPTPIGAEVLFLGRQGSETITRAELSRWWGRPGSGFFGHLRGHIRRIPTDRNLPAINSPRAS